MKYEAGPLADFPAGKIHVVEIGSRSVGIVNTGDELYAVLNICPHAMAPVCEGRLATEGTPLPSAAGEIVWGMENRILRCPWHGYEFDLADGGRTVFTNFKARVRMFPVTVEGGTVMVEMQERTAAGRPNWRERSAAEAEPAA